MAAAHAAGGEVLSEAAPEALKNMLLLLADRVRLLLLFFFHFH
jgi:hypothetical protein